MLRAGEEGDDRGWDGGMASLTQWTWVWMNSGSWWWTGRPGILWSMGLQGIRHDWATELNWTEHNRNHCPLCKWFSAYIMGELSLILDQRDFCHNIVRKELGSCDNRVKITHDLPATFILWINIKIWYYVSFLWIWFDKLTFCVITMSPHFLTVGWYSWLSTLLLILCTWTWTYTYILCICIWTSNVS